MKRLSAVLLICSLGVVPPASAQDLRPSQPLAPNIDALPRLTGHGEAVAKVNAELDRLDVLDLEAVNCSYGSHSDGPFRSVEVLSDGPEFLSFLIATGASCEGAAHPWWMQTIVNFDLVTGEKTDLRSFFPLPLQQSDDPDTPLAVLFLNAVDDLSTDCVQAYAWAIEDGYLNFNIGVAEAERALVIWPHGLGYARGSCLSLAYVAVERLREAGFNERLVRALSPLQ